MFFAGITLPDFLSSFLPPSFPPSLPSFLPSFLSFLSLFLSLSLFCIFTHFCLILLYPPLPLQSPYCCPWVLFPFCSFPPPSTLHLHLSCQPILYLWVCLYLLVSSDCSLDSTCEWNHMVFVFLWLAYFT